MNSDDLIHPVTGEAMMAATPAATMVIFHTDPGGGPPKLLMMERTKTMAFAGGAAVFPGGKVDPEDFNFANIIAGDPSSPMTDIDEIAARLAAIRETIEEAGLAYGLTGVRDPADCQNARGDLHKGSTLADICARYGWRPDLSALVPWARWRPPSRETRVFDARFYLVDAGTMRPDASVDATENTSLFWVSADEAMQMAAQEKIKIIFPTRRNLERLAQFGSFSDAADHAARYPVETVFTYIEIREGEQWLCIPEKHGYPICAEPLSRAMRG
jgi:8-oxo-dGTP pyrophosphatase MutT (NUDIX family)